MHSRAKALCVFLLIGVWSLPVCAAAEALQPRVRLELLLTTAPCLSEAARTAMMTEAAAIWETHGVAIDWLSPSPARPPAPHRLRVLVIEGRPSGTHRNEAFTVGELVRPAKGHAMAMMSIESAQRLLTSVRGRAGYDLVAVDPRRLGLVLGRALAHEIGHYLLETHTHARDGLMRPKFNALEFTDLRDRTFMLDQPASEWLKARLDPSVTTGPAVEPSRFEYGR